jgi:hypothetical protein
VQAQKWSLTRLNHSCVRNAAGNGKRNLNYSNWETAYDNGFVVLAEGRDIFTLGAIAVGGNMNPSGNLSFAKNTLVGWICGGCT